MEVVLFRARTREGADEAAYEQAFNDMLALASASPGFIGITGYAGEGGKELAVVQFESDEAIKAWYENPEHQAMQMRGRDDFFDYYDIVVATVHRRRTWVAADASRA